LVGELARRSCIRRASATTLRALSTVHAEKLWEAIVSAANEVSLADFDDNGEWADGIPARILARGIGSASRKERHLASPIEL
jgi:hypothetical protein